MECLWSVFETEITETETTEITETQKGEQTVVNRTEIEIQN